MGTLWEVLIAGFFLPAFFFGWMWAFRIIAIAAAAKMVGGMVSGVKDKIKGAVGGGE